MILAWLKQGYTVSFFEAKDTMQKVEVSERRWEWHTSRWGRGTEEGVTPPSQLLREHCELPPLGPDRATPQSETNWCILHYRSQEVTGDSNTLFFIKWVTVEMFHTQTWRGLSVHGSYVVHPSENSHSKYTNVDHLLKKIKAISIRNVPVSDLER